MSEPGQAPGAAATAPATRGPAAKRLAKQLLHATDLRIALVVWAICGWLYYLTTGFDSVSPLLAQNIPATWFPRLLIGTIAVLTLVLPFEHLLLRAGRERLDEARRARIEPMALLTAALLCATVALMPLLGTWLAMVLVTVSLPVLWGVRRWGRLVAYALLFPTLVALVFTQVLKVYFDPGLLSHVLP